MDWLDPTTNGTTENPSYMTEEQVDVLRKQIAAFATICEMLVDMHRRITAQQDSLLTLQGMGFETIYSDPFAASCPKITTRQRWTPTPMQLQILEKYFLRDKGTPSKQKVKEITSELSHHGLITEMNVYNWFQNRRARSKRKRRPSMQQNNMESEVGAEIECLHDKKSKSISSESCENLISNLEDHTSQTPEISSSMHSVYMDASANSGVLSPIDDMRSFSNLGQPSIYNSMILNHDGLDLVEDEGYYGLIG